jgi:hypothetical protein
MAGKVAGGQKVASYLFFIERSINKKRDGRMCQQVGAYPVGCSKELPGTRSGLGRRYQSLANKTE